MLECFLPLFPSLFRAVMLPSPASWATCTTWRSVGRRSQSWRRCCWAALTAGRPTSPRQVWSTTWNQSTLQWVVLRILPSNRATLDQMFGGFFFNCLHLSLTHRHLRRARRARLWKLSGRPIQSGQPVAGCSVPPPRWPTSTWPRSLTMSCQRTGPRGSSSQTWCQMTKRQERTQFVLAVCHKLQDV